MAWGPKTPGCCVCLLIVSRNPTLLSSIASITCDDSLPHVFHSIFKNISLISAFDVCCFACHAKGKQTEKFHFMVAPHWLMAQVWEIGLDFWDLIKQLEVLHQNVRKSLHLDLNEPRPDLPSFLPSFRVKMWAVCEVGVSRLEAVFPGEADWWLLLILCCIQSIHPVWKKILPKSFKCGVLCFFF